LLGVIDDIGAEKVNSVVTDNASSMRGAWDIIEAKYPHIFCNGCAAHVLNLLIQDICTMGNNEETIKKATAVAKFIRSRNALSVAFRKAQKNHMYKKFVTLPMKIRWYSQHECLCNRVENKDIIQQLCATKSLIQNYQNSIKLEKIIDTVRNDSGCRVLISKIRLPSKLIGDAESDKASISRVYMYFKELLMQDVYSDDKLYTINRRWDFIHTAYMGFAYVLNPKTKGGLGMMGSDLEDTYAELQNYLIDGEQQVFEEEFQQFVQFVAEPGTKYDDLFSRESFHARAWWFVHGRNKFPVSSNLSCKVFAILISSTASECVWSVFSFTQRNSLKNGTVNKLVYC